MAWEAINNIAADKDLPLTIVVNDNERSYAPTIGGLAEHLATLRTTRGYERFLDWGKNTLHRTPVVGGAMYETLHGMKKGLKDIVAPQGMFEDLGLKYLGPVDGHDEAAVEAALRRAKAFGGPVLVHVITEKGRGYDPARRDEGDQWHAIGKFNPETGLPFEVSGRIWTDEFNDEMVAIGAEREDVVALTAAMLIPVGLDGFAAAYPERVFDVGIAEQHAVTMASGLAYAGLHPVVAVYATFLNRAFDQLLMDAALHRAGVTFVLDRAGVTGSDGAVAQRHVGHDARLGRAGPAPGGAAGRRPGEGAAARGPRRVRRPDRDPVPQGRRGSGRPCGAPTRLCRRAARDVRWALRRPGGGGGRVRRDGCRRRREARGPGTFGVCGGPPLGAARQRRPRRPGSVGARGGRGRGQPRQRRGGRGCEPGPAGGAGRHAGAPVRHTEAVPGARVARPGPRRGGAHRRRGGDRPSPPASPDLAHAATPDLLP